MDTDGGTARNYCCAILGGIDNFVRDDYHSVILGGQSNEMRDGSDFAAIIGGQNLNENITNGDRAAMVGGFTCTGRGYASFIGGSRNSNTNLSGATNACVIGGRSSRAHGAYSQAHGRQARSYSSGAFVWGDGTNTIVTSANANEWSVQTNNGMRIYTNSNLSTGVSLANGSTSWGTISDRNVKENFEPTDANEILEKLHNVEISKWNVKGKPEEKHIGPIAQDFYEQFGLGRSEKIIDTVDLDGVTLRGIQGLYREIKQLQAEIATLS